MADVIAHERAHERSRAADERSWQAYQRTGCDAFGLDELATFWLAAYGLKEVVRRIAADDGDADPEKNYSVRAAAEVIRLINAMATTLLAGERELPLDTDADWDIAFGAWSQWRIEHVVPLGLLHEAYQEGEDS